MSVYVHYLPNAFPVVVDVDKELAAECVAVLMEPFMGGVGGVELGNGSSFALTADPYGADTRRFWLSKVSLGRLHERGLLLDVQPRQNVIH